MTTVRRWTGHEARALRGALRLSVRAFAEHLGVSARAISKWEAGGKSTSPRPDSQAILDTALGRADDDARRRFELLIHPTALPTAPMPAGPPSSEYESWQDDLDRAAIALSHQDFATATTLMDRWLLRSPLRGLDDRGRYLRARSLALLGGIHRDQGLLIGPRSATTAFARAREIFEDLDIPRRIAQADLALAVLGEMNGDLTAAIASYQAFAVDDRLRDSDRTLARVWAGRALSKLPDKASTTAAVDLLTRASVEFERQDEAGYWAFAQQKLALAHRARGDLSRAHRHINNVIGYGVAASPMQQVRLLTAHGHILVSDRRTQEDGDLAFDKAQQLATRYRLGHQLASITAIRTALDRAKPI
jgi:transcriptional regulator with XRE-family HTH domain